MAKTSEPSRETGLPKGEPERFGDLGRGLSEPGDSEGGNGDEERGGRDCVRIGATGAVVERERT